MLLTRHSRGHGTLDFVDPVTIAARTYLLQKYFRENTARTKGEISDSERVALVVTTG